MVNKIDESTHLFINKGTNTHNTQKTSRSELFRQSFEKALTGAKASGSGEIRPVSSLQEISSDEWAVQNENLSLESKTDSLLKMLDNYSSQLEDSRMPLKKIDTVLQDIKDSANDLLKETASAKHADTKLKNIAEQCAITANTEYLKFQRGDYI